MEAVVSKRMSIKITATTAQERALVSTNQFTRQTAIVNRARVNIRSQQIILHAKSSPRILKGLKKLKFHKFTTHLDAHGNCGDTF